MIFRHVSVIAGKTPPLILLMTRRVVVTRIHQMMTQTRQVATRRVMILSLILAQVLTPVQGVPASHHQVQVKKRCQKRNDVRDRKMFFDLKCK